MVSGNENLYKIKIKHFFHQLKKRVFATSENCSPLLFYPQSMLPLTILNCVFEDPALFGTGI
jgi:hypothetical protein